MLTAIFTTDDPPTIGGRLQDLSVRVADGSRLAVTAAASRTTRHREGSLDLVATAVTADTLGDRFDAAASCVARVVHL